MSAAVLRCDLCEVDPAPCDRHALDGEIVAAMHALADALDRIERPDLAAGTRALARLDGHGDWYRALCWARDRRGTALALPLPDVAAQRVERLAWGVRGMLLRTGSPAEARAFWREQVAAADAIDPPRRAAPAQLCLFSERGRA